MLVVKLLKLKLNLNLNLDLLALLGLFVDGGLLVGGGEALELLGEVLLGDLLQASDPPAALAEFQAGMAIRQTLAAKDPANLEGQRDLSISHIRIGDLLKASDPKAALAEFRAGMKIAQALAAKDPANLQWQRDLYASHWRLANMGERPRENWQAVVTILEAFETRGVLWPADRPHLEMARRNRDAARE